MNKVKLYYIVLVALLFCGWILNSIGEATAWHLDNDFAHFYLTGLLVRNAWNPYGVALDPWYATIGLKPSFPISEATAPPALAVLLALFSLRPPPVAFILWTIMQVSTFVAAIVLLVRHLQFRLSPVGLICVVLGSLAPFGVFLHLRYGQTQLFMFFLITLGIILLQRSENWPWRLGVVCWGLATSLKLFTLPLLYVAWRYRGLAGVFWFSIGFVLLLIPFIALSGADSATMYMLKSLPYVQDVADKFSGNISLSGTLINLQRALIGHDILPPAVFQGACMLLVIPLMALERKSAPDVVASSCIALVTSCLLSPTTWQHYLPLLTGGLLYLAKQALTHSQSAEKLLQVLALYAYMATAIIQLAWNPLTQVVTTVWCLISMMWMLYLLHAARNEAQSNCMG